MRHVSYPCIDFSTYTYLIFRLKYPVHLNDSIASLVSKSGNTYSDAKEGGAVVCRRSGGRFNLYCASL